MDGSDEQDCGEFDDKRYTFRLIFNYSYSSKIKPAPRRLYRNKRVSIVISVLCVLSVVETVRRFVINEYAYPSLCRA